MELVRGEPASAVLERRGRLPSVEVVPLVAQAAHGLAAAHGVGVVHRDVKPANLLITPVGEVRITDFGISRAVDQDSLTGAGMVMGTAHYLAPERARGGTATPASDLYALGVLAYELLAGHRPFTGPTDVAIALAHVEHEPPPLPGDVPAPVRDVVTWLLAKDPDHRPPTGTAAAHALEALDAAHLHRHRRVPGATARPAAAGGARAATIGTLTLPERPAPACAVTGGGPEPTTARNS
jgi:serine/threonine protein kinase